MIKHLFSVCCVLGLSLSLPVAASAGIGISNDKLAFASGSDLAPIQHLGVESLVDKKLVDASSKVDGRDYLQVASRYHNPRYRKHYSRRSYSHRSHYGNGLGYFVGGLIIGGILSDHHNHSGHSNSRYDTRQPSRYDTNAKTSAPVYWLDKRGDCFRLERRSHGDVYVQVAGEECY